MTIRIEVLSEDAKQSVFSEDLHGFREDELRLPGDATPGARAVALAVVKRLS